MQELNKHDLNWALRLLPKPVKALMEKEGAKLVLGGGFLRSAVAGERPNDIDLFVRSEEDAKRYAAELADGKTVLETGNAYSVRRVGGYFVQFIHRWTYDTPGQLLESTIACAAIWYQESCEHWGSIVETRGGENTVCARCRKRDPDGQSILPASKWNSLCDDDFYSDLAAKRLVYRSPQRNEDAGGSMLRVLKFYQIGFRIPLDSLGAVVARMAVRCAEGCGSKSETEWAEGLTKLLHEVDPAVDFTHAAHLSGTKQ